MNIANKINSRFAIIVGEDEVKNNQLTIKNLDKGVEEKIGVVGLVEYLR